MTTRVEFDLKLANKVGQDAATRGIRAVTEEARNILVADILSRPGTGITYDRGARSHTASAPGEPPAPDTGTLRSRIFTEVVTEGDRVRGIVTANTEYAAALERGTERMRPRPFLSRLIREHAGRLRDVFNKFAGG